MSLGHSLFLSYIVGWAIAVILFCLVYLVGGV